MSQGVQTVIAIGPEPFPNWVRDAVRSAGAQVSNYQDATGLIWVSPTDVAGLDAVLRECPHINWVQIPFAGVENFISIINNDRVWTCGKGVYAEPVAEHALGLILAGLRNIGVYAQETSWTRPIGRNLLGARVTIVGGGGIAVALVRLLQPFSCHITVVRHSVTDMDGVDQVVSAESLIDALVGADVVVLALSLTPETQGLLSRAEFELMEPHAWVINVARGKHIVTDDLVWALTNNKIGGAALDVTDPEPLPVGHPLWSEPHCIITPHTGNTPEMAEPLLAQRISANVASYMKGEQLIGTVDSHRGY
ncbi:MAG: D-isomer specific 2-hydroxyacid dehydrogenase family protein [Actinobacteria bacterium]|nr:D-isomer specific 2-hydroxyacid dehydrogenase family protein [Actinomycetota bacterium]